MWISRRKKTNCFWKLNVHVQKIITFIYSLIIRHEKGPVLFLDVILHFKFRLESARRHKPMNTVVKQILTLDILPRFPLPCLLCPFLSLKIHMFSAGHLPSTRGVRYCSSDRGHYRKSVLPGECCPFEQVQGASFGKALSGGDVFDTEQGFGHTGDQSPGTRYNKS